MTDLCFFCTVYFMQRFQATIKMHFLSLVEISDVKYCLEWETSDFQLTLNRKLFNINCY